MVYATTLAAYEGERPEDLRPALLTRILGGEWTRSFPFSRMLIRVTQRGFLYLERGGLHVWGTLGGEMHLEDRERYWGHYAILKDLLLSAIAHLEDKEEAAGALALLSNALSALEEGEKKPGGEEMKVRKYLNLLHNLLAYRLLKELERGRLAMAASVARVFIGKADMLIGGLFAELPQAATNDGLGYLPEGRYRYGHLYLTSDGSIALTLGDGEGHYAYTAYKWPTPRTLWQT